MSAWAAALAAPLALLAALALAAPAAEAQTSSSLVSNNGQASTDSHAANYTRSYATSFTTGSDPLGYKLTRVDFWKKRTAQALLGSDYVTVSIATNDAGIPSGSLGTSVVLQGSTTSFARASAEFSVDLAPNTKYWVTFALLVPSTSGAATDFLIGGTSSDAEDSGGQSGWSIGNHRLFLTSGGSWSTSNTNTNALRLNLRGYAKTVTVSKVPHRGDALTVRWPSYPGAVDYDVRYYAGTADPTNASDWVQEGEANGPANPGTATAMTITGLTAQTAYRVQVRAWTSATSATAWSTSGGATTGRGESANRAPRARQRTGSTCPDVSVPAVLTTTVAPSGTQTSGTIVEPTDGRCDQIEPTIYDPDGDALTVTITGVEVEAGKTVGFLQEPFIINNRTDSVRVAVTRANKHENATVTVGLKVEDPHGASVTTSATFTGGAWPGSSVPSVADPDDLALARDAAMTPVALPAATGGDTAVSHSAGTVDLGYTYAVSGLPAGLSFDAATRTISGTPSADGTYTVTYTADDADASYSQKASPQQADLDDAASQEFTITVAAAPGQASAPTVSNQDASSNALAGGSLRVSWTAVTGATDYDLRYYAGSADPADEADWVEEGGGIAGLPDPGSGTSATITGLKAGTAYRVQVRAGTTVEGAWSDSGSATTNAAASGNNAPRGLEGQTGSNTCFVTTSKLAARIVAEPGLTKTLGDLYGRNGDTGQWPAICTNGSNSAHSFYFFDDVDGDTLTFSYSAARVPDNVRFRSLYLIQPTGSSNTGLIGFSSVAAHRPTNTPIDVTATDPDGASHTRHFVFVHKAWTGTSAPRFTETVAGVRGFAVNTAIEDWVLPAATGGDVTYGTNAWARWPYLYRVTGLPPGLSFDPATRTVSGTPTRTGDFEVVYTADDADFESANLNPNKFVPADTAVQRFVIRIGDGPAIEQVRIVSSPTRDADGDGRFDTYIRGDEILFDVEFSEPVAVTLPQDNSTVRLRIDLGTDDTDLDNSRETADLESVLNGGRTLRFAYTVAASDTDTDGVWVQRTQFDTVLFLVRDATVTSADTGLDAALTKDGLPTTGDAHAKVDGSVATASGPSPVSATVVERTMTVKFDRNLHRQTAWWDLALFFSVKGAGPVDGDHRNAYQHPSAVRLSSSSNDTLTLTLNTPARAGDTVTLTYRLAEGGGLLRGAGGSRAAGFRDLAVTNNTAGRAPVVPLRAAIAGKTLRFMFKGPLDEASAPAGNAFTVLAEDLDGDLRAIRGTGTARIAGSDVTVTLAARVEADELASVSYAKPGTAPLRYSVGVEVDSFEDFRVHSVSDATPPKLKGRGVRNSRTSPAQSKVLLQYDELLDTGSVPAAGDFAVTFGGADEAVSSVAAAGLSVVLTLDRSVANGTTVAVTYTPGTNPIRDLAGNSAASFQTSMTGTAGLPGRPTTFLPQVDGVVVRIASSQPLDPLSVPDPSAFALHYPLLAGQTTVTPYPIDIVEVRINGIQAELHLAHPVHPCAGATPFKLTYTKPSTSPIQSFDGTDASEFTNDVANDRSSLCGTNWVETVTIGSVILRAKRPFARADAPDKAWFAVTASGGPVTVTGAAFDPNDAHVLKLEVSREFGADETVTVSYARPPGARGLWNVDGKQLADVTDWPVSAAPAGPPEVTGLAVVSDAGGDGTYGGGERVLVEVTWDRDVTWDVSRANAGIGVRLDVGGVTRRAELVTQGSTGGTARALRFAYTVADGDVDDDGVSVVPAANGRLAIARRGATLRGAGGRDADVTHAGLGPDPAHKVDWRLAPDPAADTAAPVLESASVDGKRLTLAFDEALAAADTGGLPFALLVDGIVAGGSVSPERVAIDGAAAARNALRDLDGNAVASFAGAAVENRTPRPAVAATGVSVSSAPAEGDTYGFGETIRVTVNFSEAVAVTGTPRLAIDMDPAHWGTKWAAYESGSGTAALVFAHRVVEPNVSTRGIAVLANTLEANGGAIASVSAGAGAALGHAGLDHDPAHKVDWRPALSVADAEAHEGTDAAVEFTVTLSRAAGRTVTVDYATADGTAVAGEDYTATSGTLTFRAGESSKTVSVPILDDALDEGRETFLLRLSNARGARIADGEATGTIENSDPLQKMWLSRFGRTVADHVTGAVADRLAKPLSGAQVTVGGQSVNLAEAGDGAVLTQTLTAVARALGAPDGPAPAGDGPGSLSGTGGWPGTGLGSVPGTGPGVSGPADAGTPGRVPEGRELLLGSAFHLATDGERSGPGLAAWGRVTAGGFDGEAPADGGSVRIDGNVVTGILGADAEWNRLLAGVAVSVSEGEGTFDQPGVDSGTIESTMTTVSPYARFMVTERVSVWGLAGWGTGDMTIVQAANDRGQPERVTRTDLEMRLAALGGRGALLTQDEAGGFDLALKADAFWVETESKAVSNEGDTAATASRVRLALEGSRAFKLGSGTLTPGVELGLRHDGGDAETGTGVELGGGVSWSDPETGLSVEAKARTLIAHEDSNYREWGASGAVRLSPGERGRGLSFSLAPTYGAASSGVDRLWGARDARGLAPEGAFEAEQRLQGELGYGLGLFGDRFTGTPNLGFGFSDNARDYRLGWRLTSAIRGDPGFEVNLDAMRKEPANANTPPEHGVMLRAAIRW